MFLSVNVGYFFVKDIGFSCFYVNCKKWYIMKICVKENSFVVERE